MHCSFHGAKIDRDRVIAVVVEFVYIMYKKEKAIHWLIYMMYASIEYRVISLDLGDEFQ